MAKRRRRSKFLYPITIIFSIILVITLCLNIYLFLKPHIEKVNKEELKDINERISSLNDEYKKYSNLDELISNERKEYYSKIKELEDKILNGESDKKIVYITFDDGPYYNTYDFLEILNKYNVKATFFTTNINGQYCFDNKKEDCFLLYKEYLKYGHTIANHTYTHGIKYGLYSSADSFINAVKKQEEHVKEKTDGYITNIVRFPGGSRTSGSNKNGIIEKLREMNYGWVDWTAQDGDGGNLTSKEQAWSNFKSSINDKIEVILFHDYNNITKSILPDAIEYLKENGYIPFSLFYESNMVNK